LEQLHRFLKVAFKNIGTEQAEEGAEGINLADIALVK
jgi:hypothetical protein